MKALVADWPWWLGWCCPLVSGGGAAVLSATNQLLPVFASSDRESIFFNSHNVSKPESSSVLTEVCPSRCGGLLRACSWLRVPGWSSPGELGGGDPRGFKGPFCLPLASVPTPSTPCLHTLGHCRWETP